jgi:predicted nucleic acid-binding protein
VAQLVDLDQALITGVVVAELLQGVRYQREAEALSNMLSVLPLLETLQVDWMETGTLCVRCANGE